MKIIYLSFFLTLALNWTAQSQYSIKQHFIPEESKPIITDTLYIPFFEDWSSGSLEANGWVTNCNEWHIDDLQGNPAPSVRYTGTQNCFLYSAYFDARGINQGDIWLEFILKLETDYAGSWGDILELAINESNTWWNPVAKFRSTSGSFDWDTIRINISEIARKSVFQLRFETWHYDGNDTAIQWHVDNLHIYRECDPPKKFHVAVDTTDYDTYQLQFSWEMDSILQGTRLHWGNDKNYSGIGAGVNVTGAIRWDPHQLVQYDGDTILGMRVFIFDDAFEKLVFRIWEGANAAQQIYHDTIPSFQSDSWVDHFVDTLLVIDEAKEYWVGYTVFNTAAGTFPLGTDKGPAVANYGDMVSHDYKTAVEWDRLTDYGLDYNWNIQLILNDSSNIIDGLTRYNLYQQKNNDEQQLLAQVPWGTNTVFIPFEANSASYCYQLTAQWEDSLDFCESAPAHTLLGPLEDEICIQLVEDPDIHETNQKPDIFPNPAKDALHISSGNDIVRIQLISYLGQVVLSKYPHQKQISVNLAAIKSGIYILNIKTDKKTFTEKIVIKH